MGLNAAMEIGRSGLMTYQAANEVTSQNIANVNTPGYSRQKVVLESASTATSASGFTLESGVRISTIERVYDGLLQQQIVSSNTTQSYNNTKSQVLQQIEPVLNESLADGLGASVSNFFASWQDLSTNPTGYFERQTVLNRSQILADNFHAISQSLNNTIATQDAALKPLTDSINTTLQGIARLNDQISNINKLDGYSSETRDQRDQLIKDLSQKMGVKFTENQDGTTDVYVQNGAAKNYLVQGSLAGSVATGGTAPATTVTITDVAKATVAVDPNAVPPLYTAPDGGQLWATLQLRDKIVPGYLTQIDTLAKSITDAVNTKHAAGYSPTGGTGQNFFAPAAATANAAKNFGLAAGLTSGTIAASTSVTLPSDNANARAIASLVNDVTTTTPPTPGASTTSFKNFYNTFVSNVGNDVQTSKNNVVQDDAYIKQLSALRDSNSGVSLDEELTNLVKYQRSYQASAKLITTVTDMMDITIAMVR